MYGDVAVTSAVKNFPRPHMARREHWVNQVTERRHFPRAQGDGSVRDKFEGIDQPHDRPGRVFEPVDQDCPPLAEAAARQFSAVGYSAAVVGVGREDFLGCRILIAAVVRQTRIRE